MMKTWKGRQVIAWMGGSSPPLKLPAEVKELSRALFNEQVSIFRSYWGNTPDPNTRQIFRGRANADAWATFRDDYENKPSARKPRPKKKRATRSYAEHVMNAKPGWYVGFKRRGQVRWLAQRFDTESEAKREAQAIADESGMTCTYEQRA